MAATRARWPLAAAAGVGALAAGAARAQSQLDFKLLLYGEDGDRTQVWNPELYFTRDFEEKGKIGLLLAYDGISGASPTGEYPTLDATASASSQGVIPTASYTDTRRAASVSYARRFGSHLPSVDLSWSRESDYLSRGISAEDSWDLFGGRSTLHLGAGITRDLVEPVTSSAQYDKSSTAFSLGWTWIAGPRDLFDVSLGLTSLQGYLDDPYKVVPVGATTQPEHRPDSRSRRALMLKYGHYFLSRTAVKVSYRFYTDDWSVRADTLELVCDRRLGQKWIVTPRLRLYQQGAASFFAYEFPEARTYMSSDYRLSSFWSWLVGVGASREMTPQLSLNVAATYMSQTGRDRVVPRMAAPAGQISFAGLGEEEEEGEGGSSPLSPADLTTITLTAGLSFRF